MSKDGAPIFFIGFPRSGTTVTFEAFSRHPMLGWPSAYTEMFPNAPVVEGLRRLLDNSVLHMAGKKGQYGRTMIGNRFLPQPNEAYRFWDLKTGVNFSRSFLRNSHADADVASRVRDAVARVLQWQGRSRFTAKLTGPPRITYLNSIFPDSHFIHIVRDGRAAVHSLLRVGFWQDKGGLTQPFWKGGLLDDQEQLWRDSGSDPGTLAALQWVAILKAARTEGSRLREGRYREFRYEDFVQFPHRTLREMYEFSDLEDSPAGHAYVNNNVTLPEMNQKFRKDFSTAYIETLTSVMQPALDELNYPV